MGDVVASPENEVGLNVFGDEPKSLLSCSLFLQRFFDIKMKIEYRRNVANCHRSPIFGALVRSFRVAILPSAAKRNVAEGILPLNRKVIKE